VSDRSKNAVLNVRVIRIALADKGWSQDKLAQETGTSKATISSAMNTRRTSIDTVLSMARVLGLTPNQILVGWQSEDQDAPPENLAAALTRRATKSRAAVAA
jgi:transcriptional regulator with XRE-family HTH domain